MPARLPAAIVGAFCLVPTLAAQSTTRVSVASTGAQANGDSGGPVISADGRFVTFASTAPNLVMGDTNGSDDVFVRDRLGATTQRVSVSGGGAEGNADSYRPRISGDGRFVAFVSAASNLVSGDTNQVSDVFVRDRQLATTQRASVGPGGVEAGSYSGSEGLAISANGRFVAFVSNASNLVVGDTNGGDDVFVRDLQSGTTERVSLSNTGGQGNSSVNTDTTISISADGRFVAFSSYATNLVPGDTNMEADVFVRDRQLGTTERVNVDSAGMQASWAECPSISADGRMVAFCAGDSNLVAGDNNGVEDVFVRDRQSGTTQRVSVTTAGAQGNANSGCPAIAAHGRIVAFDSGSDLVAGDTNGSTDVFMRDMQSGTTIRVSLTTGGGQGNSSSSDPALSDDGRFIAFESDATNLVAGDTNGVEDAFVRDRGPQPPSAYCTAGATSHGCLASITASANPSVTLAGACSLDVSGVEGQKAGILFYGIDNIAFVPAPWASGSTSLLCVKQPTQRTLLQNSGGTVNACNGSFTLDWNAYQTTHPLALGNPWNIGAKVYVQAWFRDPLAVKSTNLSNAVEMTYIP